MNETDFLDLLIETISYVEDEGEGSDWHDKGWSYETYKEGGYLTDNKGLVIKIGDDTFHMTVVQG